MKFLEKNLEDIIWEAELDALSDRGLKVGSYSVKFRQLKIGNYGIADMVWVKRLWDVEYDNHEPIITPYLRITVFELKRDTINESAFFQALNYVHGIKTYIEQHRTKDLKVEFQIVLIGSEINKSGSFCYLSDYLNGSFWLSFYTYDYQFDGIYFKSKGNYSLIEDGF